MNTLTPVGKKLVVALMALMVFNLASTRTLLAADNRYSASAAKVTVNEPGGDTSDEQAISEKKGGSWIWLLLIAAVVAGGAAALAGGGGDSSDGGSSTSGSGSVEATW